MAMSPPTPHLCTIKRITRADGETYTTPTQVSINNPCLFAPASSTLMQTFAGGAETVDSLLFIGYDVDIQAMDEVTDEDSLEVYYVTEPPIPYRNPTNWTNDHKQCKVTLKPTQ